MSRTRQEERAEGLTEDADGGLRLELHIHGHDVLDGEAATHLLT